MKALGQLAQESSENALTFKGHKVIFCVERNDMLRGKIFSAMAGNMATR